MNSICECLIVYNNCTRAPTPDTSSPTTYPTSQPSNNTPEPTEPTISPTTAIPTEPSISPSNSPTIQTMSPTIGCSIPFCNNVTEICSPIDYRCYGAFLQSDYDNITITKSFDDTPINLIPVSSIDMNDLLDLNTSTGHYLDYDSENGQIFNYYISFFCPGPRGFWFHRIEIIVDAVPNNLQIFIPGAGAEVDDNFNKVEDMDFIPYLIHHQPYPFFAKNISIRITADEQVTLYSINIYVAKDSLHPTTDPTEMPTGM